MKGVERSGRELTYVMVYPDDYEPQRAYPLIVLLHGYGASMHDLAGLTPAIDQRGYIYACPNAPVEVDFGPGQFGESVIGYSWRPPRGAVSPEDAERVEKMAEEFVAEVMEEHKVPPGRALLLGFSQGGSMTYRIGLRRPELFAGLVVLSIGLPEDMKTRLPAVRTIPIFIGHGLYDNVERGRQASAFLQSEGYAPTYHEYPIGHEITQHVLDDLAPWIHAVLPPAAE